MDLQKLLKIIAAVVGVVSIIFLVTIIFAGDDAIKAGESASSVVPICTWPILSWL